MTKKSSVNRTELSNDKINVLVMGTSGAGKSTLINSVIEGANAPTGAGKAVTKEMKAYSDNNNPFRLIDTVGYEFNLLKQLSLKHNIDKWTKEGAKKKDASKYIHMIWFCLDVQAKRVFYEVLDSIRNVSKTWKDIPIIVVLTKSFGTEEEDEKNKDMFNETISSYKHQKDLNIRDIIPVVAIEYHTPAGIVPSKGLDRLINRTNELVPEAMKLHDKDLIEIDLKIKKTSSNVWIIGSTAAAITVGAIPIDLPDATLLLPIQSNMLARISSIYNISDKSVENKIIECITSAGVATVAGKAIINKLKNIPSIAMKVATSALNAIVAGVITATLGEIAVTLFDGINRGILEFDDNTDWVVIIEDLISKKLPNYFEAIEKALKDDDSKDILHKITVIIEAVIKKNEEMKNDEIEKGENVSLQ